MWTYRSSLPTFTSSITEPVKNQPLVKTPEHKILETALLPLRVTTDRVSERVEMLLGGGAIELVGEKILIMDRLGKIFIYKDGDVTKNKFPDLPMHINDFSKSSRFPLREETLRAHDLIFDTTQYFLYVSYDSYEKTSGTMRFEISRIPLSKSTTQAIGVWELIYQSSPIPLTDYYSGRAAGGKMSIHGRNLYFSIGDYNLDRITSSSADIAAQNIKSPFGKIYKYNLTLNSLTLLSIGHRVPQGLAVTSSGHILETEHGPRGGDELNLIQKGKNYGWPYLTYGTSYASYRRWSTEVALDPTALKEKTTEPVFAWVPSIAVTSLFESNRFNQRWNGNIIVGSLKAQSLFRLKYIDGRVIFSEPIWIGHRIRDLVEQQGCIIAWSDDGSLIFIKPEIELIEKDQLNFEDGYKKNSALKRCSFCHSLSSHNQFNWAPTLNGIFGRKIASDKFQNYSAALKNKEGVWDEANLTAFLIDPQRYLPGTTMGNPDLTENQISEIVMELKTTPLQK